MTDRSPLYLNAKRGDRSYRLEPTPNGMKVTRYDAEKGQIRTGSEARRAIAADGFFAGLELTTEARSTFPPSKPVEVVI